MSNSSRENTQGKLSQVKNCSDNVTRKSDSEAQLTDQTKLLPFKQIIPVFLALSAVNLVTTLDSVVVSASLSTVSSAFDAGSVSSWIPAAYLMTSTAFQPLYGRLSDIFGRKATLCIAMSIYFVGNLVAGFSNSIIQLIIFRAVAGAGDGGATSMVSIIISDVVSLRDRGKYIGIAGAVTAIGYAVGPIIGGSLAQHATWRWCFWITLPLAVLSSLIVLFLLPLKPVQGNMRSKLLIIDYVGVLLTLSACTLIILPLVWGGVTFPWNSAIVLGPLCSGIFAVGLFCFWEAKGAKLPIVPMYIFKHMTVTGVYICMFANGFMFFAAVFYLPQFFQVIMQDTPTRAATFIIPVAVSLVISAIVSGIVMSRTGKYRPIVYCGFAMSSIGCGCISTFAAHTPRAVMIVLMLLVGIGSGATMQTTTVAAQASVARKDMSVVTAVRNFVRMLGGALALPCASSLLNNALRSSMQSLNLPPSTVNSIVNNPSLLSTPSSINLNPSTAQFILSNGYTKGFRDVFLLNAALSVLAFVVSITMVRHKELLRGDEERLKREALGQVETEMTKMDAETGAGSTAVGERRNGLDEGDMRTVVDVEMGALESVGESRGAELTGSDVKETGK